MDEVLPIFSRLLGYGGKIYALPYDGDDHMMAFRGDLFSDTENQSKFKAKYGYDMDPVQGPGLGRARQLRRILHRHQLEQQRQ